MPTQELMGPSYGKAPLAQGVVAGTDNDLGFQGKLTAGSAPSQFQVSLLA